MKARTIVTGLLATVILSSCTVLSFYPLYTEKELIRMIESSGNGKVLIIRTLTQHQKTIPK